MQGSPKRWLIVQVCGILNIHSDNFFCPADHHWPKSGLESVQWGSRVGLEVK